MGAALVPGSLRFWLAGHPGRRLRKGGDAVPVPQAFRHLLLRPAAPAEVVQDHSHSIGQRFAVAHQREERRPQDGLQVVRRQPGRGEGTGRTPVRGPALGRTVAVAVRSTGHRWGSGPLGEGDDAGSGLRQLSGCEPTGVAALQVPVDVVADLPYPAVVQVAPGDAADVSPVPRPVQQPEVQHVTGGAGVGVLRHRPAESAQRRLVHLLGVAGGGHVGVPRQPQEQRTGQRPDVLRGGGASLTGLQGQQHDEAGGHDVPRRVPRVRVQAAGGPVAVPNHVAQRQRGGRPDVEQVGHRLRHG